MNFTHQSCPTYSPGAVSRYPVYTTAPWTKWKGAPNWAPLGMENGPQACFAGSPPVMGLRERPLLLSGVAYDPVQDQDQRCCADLHSDLHHGHLLLSEAPPTLGTIITETARQLCRKLAAVPVYFGRKTGNHSTNLNTSACSPIRFPRGCPHGDLLHFFQQCLRPQHLVPLYRPTSRATSMGPRILWLASAASSGSNSVT